MTDRCRYQALPTQDPEIHQLASVSSSPSRSRDSVGDDLSRRNSLGDIFSRLLMRQSMRGEDLVGALHDLHSQERPRESHPTPVNEWSCCAWGTKLLESLPFQIFMAIAIIVNALVIGFETDMPDLHMWDLIEALFLFIFTGELTLRLAIHGVCAFFDPRGAEFFWNCFDFTIVGIGLFDASKFLGVIIFPQDAHGNSTEGGGGFTTLFRIVRLLRILRIFRIVRFLKQLYMLVFGFGVAAIATGWVTVLAVVIIYVCSIVMVRLVHASDPNDESYGFYSDKFGSVGVSMFTLFQLMLNPDLAPYEDSLSRYYVIASFLCVFVVFGSFGMLALLTGVISESMFEKNQVRLEEERGEREQKRKILSQVCSDLFDDIARGKLEVSADELKELVPKLVDLFMKYGFAFTEYDLKAVFDVTDTDDSGGISRNEFVHAICSSSEGIKCATVMELHQSVALIGIRGEKRSAETFAQLDHITSMLARLEERLNALGHPQTKPKISGAEFQVRASDMNIKFDSFPMQNGFAKAMPIPSTIGNSSFYVGIDSKLALKIDACEAMVREMRRTTAEIADSTRELIKRAHLSSGTGFTHQSRQSPSPDAKCHLQNIDDYSFGPIPDPWNELEFVAPLEIADMCDSREASGADDTSSSPTAHAEWKHAAP